MFDHNSLIWINIGGEPFSVWVRSSHVMVAESRPQTCCVAVAGSYSPAVRGQVQVTGFQCLPIWVWFPDIRLMFSPRCWLI